MVAELRSAVEQFVRDGLGCSCPREVFRSVSIDRLPAAGGGPSLTELQVGSRLLIRFAELPDDPSACAWLEGVAKDGCAARDRGGFNRFRLVLTTSEAPADTGMLDRLRPRFERATARDERAHLHVVERSQLPGELSAATVAK